MPQQHITLYVVQSI